MDPIKEAFSKIKEDILFLKKEISSLKYQLSTISNPTNKPANTPTHNPTHNHLISPTINHNPTHIQTNQARPQAQILPRSDIPTHIQAYPTHNSAAEAPYSQNIDSSIGNRGVPTNKPTNIQTNQQTYNSGRNTSFLRGQTYQNDYANAHSDFKQANEILESLDSIKRGIRLKFKRLTPQEMLVFSTLYTLEEQNMDEITYKAIAKKLNLSESSIRDYTNKLIKKGIPIEKIRQNNKIIILKISQDLKNVATLTTIHQLREL